MKSDTHGPLLCYDFESSKRVVSTNLITIFMYLNRFFDLVVFVDQLRFQLLCVTTLLVRFLRFRCVLDEMKFLKPCSASLHASLGGCGIV